MNQLLAPNFLPQSSTKSKKNQKKEQTAVIQRVDNAIVNNAIGSPNTYQAPVVQKVDSAIRWINLYPVDSAIGFPNTYPLGSDLSGGQSYPTF